MESFQKRKKNPAILLRAIKSEKAKVFIQKDI